MPSREEITYFGAGPAGLFTDVLEDAAQALLNFNGTGLGIAEHSHRSEHATKIINEAKADLASFLDIPEDYEVLFMQGGGTGEFSAVVYNLVGAWVTKKRQEIFGQIKATDSEDLNNPTLMQELRGAVDKELKLDYIVTGSWSQKAAAEAARLLGPEHVNIVTDARQINDGKFGKIPEESTWKLSKNAALTYYCANETVDGVEIGDFPQSLAPGPDGNGPIVVADMSSNILSRKIPVKNFSLIFFGAQKNLGCTGVTVVVIKKSLLPPVTPQPSATILRQLGLPIPPIILQYETIAKNNSLYNTLSIFDVYVAGRVLKKLLQTYPNKVEGQESVAKSKAERIYGALDAHPDVYRVVPDKAARSRMNICFRVTKGGDVDAAEKAFLKAADAADPRVGVLDSEALVLYFPAPRTVTGEDVLELHIHGGSATIKAVLGAIPRCHTHTRVRYAEPGEFTKRAFIHDRLDLAQIEALSDTLAAETEQQRRAAVRGTSGALGRTYEAWRQQLLLARGEIEALIDFSEDQQFDEPQAELLQNVTAQVQSMLQSIRLHEQGSQRSELLRSGIRIALLGPPNVGKSSLMNLIVGREASIVSGEAGTTRDIVEASLDIRGYLCSFADTAGFRSKHSANEQPIGAVEREGIRRAKEKAQASDIIVVLAAVEAGPNGPFIHFDEETLDIAAQAEASLVVVNKQDSVDATRFASLLDDFKQKVSSHKAMLRGAGIVPISCRAAQATAGGEDPGGIQGLVSIVAEAFSNLTSMPVDLQDLLGVTARQRELLVKCRGHLEAFMSEAQPEAGEADADTVLAAEYLRYAADCLARITGKGESGDVEDVLGVVFEK
ncbi:Phosphoserine aminotransferase [Paramyrothecium foliicola]|nr:Phosphoserine aminotransferase [Paramyrothecium foliicola]